MLNHDCFNQLLHTRISTHKCLIDGNIVWSTWGWQLLLPGKSPSETWCQSKSGKLSDNQRKVTFSVCLVQILHASGWRGFGFWGTAILLIPFANSWLPS